VRRASLVLQSWLTPLVFAQTSVSSGSLIPVWAGRPELLQVSLSTPVPGPSAAESLTSSVLYKCLK